MTNLFGDYLFLAVIFLAILPFFEGRVAIPFALSFGLNPVLAFFCAFLGSILPAAPIVFVTKKIKSKFFTGFVMQKYSVKLDRLAKQTTLAKKLFLLATFVAIPLPMTGVWSGSLIGGITSLKIWQASLAIVFGSLVSCGIILAVCLLFAGEELVILYASLVMLAIAVLFEAISLLIKRRRAVKK